MTSCANRRSCSLPPSTVSRMYRAPASFNAASLAADLLRRSVERVLLGGAALVGVGEHMRAALASGRAGHAHRALGVLGLTSQSGLGVRPIPRDIQLARHRDPHRIERSPVRFTLGAVERDALADLLGGRVLVEHEVEATRGRSADRCRAPGGHPERRVRSLRGRRLDHDVLEAPEPAAGARNGNAQASDRVMTSTASSNRASASSGGIWKPVNSLWR